MIPAVVASRNSHGNGDCDQNPDRYREGDSNRHSNSTTAPNSNSHSIGHIYSDGYRYANEAPTATSTPTVALSCGCSGRDDQEKENRAQKTNRFSWDNKEGPPVK